MLCPSGHLTSVRDQVCRSCDLATDPSSDIVVGERPVLGTITFDDGAVLPLSRPAVIGSDVPKHYEINGEPATIVRLDDGHDGVDGVHLELQLVGWEIEATDRSSQAGTFYRFSGESDTRTRFRSEQPTELRNGMRVELGARSFVFTLGPPKPQ